MSRSKCIPSDGLATCHSGWTFLSASVRMRGACEIREQNREHKLVLTVSREIQTKRYANDDYLTLFGRIEYFVNNYCRYNVGRTLDRGRWTRLDGSLTRRKPHALAAFLKIY
ncbi:hypothetical protein EVAR_12276_1 [Eumeta japonica]|uniref:Uncharacterized protein n=1 Tax=Eumeta variegata TaxID=151549 RepID=A0A4C1TUW5_EUMVA|nr:hypothetical protein EVAR_12276_1 [Eumeta japonica]